jgi:hypothetical protein
MTHVRRIGWTAIGAVTAVLATAVPAVAEYPPDPNVLGKTVAPDTTIAFTGSDLAPLLWAASLLAVGLVLLFVGRRAASAKS